MSNYFYRIHPWLEKWYRRATYHTGDERLLLTFDDGPHPEWTRRLLAILTEFQVRAVFFLWGDRMQRHPELAPLLHAAGHQTGLHGMYHNSWRFHSRGDIRSELNTQLALFQQAELPSPHWVRPPYGACGPAYRRVVTELGLSTMLWRLAPRDYRARSGEQLLQRLWREQRPGDIVLLHDGATGTPHLLEVLPAYLEGSRARGLRFVAPGEDL